MRKKFKRKKLLDCGRFADWFIRVCFKFLILHFGLFLPRRPVQRALLPGVDMSDFEDRQKCERAEEHLQADAALTDRFDQIAKNRGPSEKENDFDVEQDEQHRDQVKLHTETRVRLGQRWHAALVRAVFDRVVRAFLAQKRWQGNADRRETSGDQHQKSDRDILL